MTRTAPSLGSADAWQATNRHYELPVEVFAAYLDRRLKYSSGLYAGPGTSLDDAQTAKLHFVAARLGLTGGERILDIGCGWGSLILFMAQEYGCRSTGVTPSATQADHIRALARRDGLDPLVEVHHGSFTDSFEFTNSSEADADGRYDAVTMLGSVVHMPDRDAVLAKAHRLLRPGGTLYLSESCFRNAATYSRFAGRPGTRHVTEDIFGFADMVPLSVLVQAVESAGFSLTGLADLTAHYKRTVDDWEQRALTNRDAIEDAVPGLCERLVRYLRIASAGWGYTTKHYALCATRSRLGPEGPLS
jgi:cyclopropane-fatty-acyl-phospholipid synthase